jgi:hypothetical protein
MLEFSKIVLSKISFDKFLFKKELGKALKWIKPHEQLILKVWVVAQFGHMYKDVIQDVFER